MKFGCSRVVSWWRSRGRSTTISSKITPADLKIHADIATDMGLLKKPANLNDLVLP